MTKAQYETEIIQKIHLLSTKRQRSVLAYIKSLLEGTNNKNLLQFAGTISPEDAKKMEDAINEGCETIDYNEW